MVISIAPATILFRNPFWVIRGKDLETRPLPEEMLELPRMISLPGRWVEAGHVQIGDQLLLVNGKEVSVEEVETVSYAEKVFNLEIAKIHTYAVGKTGLLVNNSNCQLGDLGEGIGRVAPHPVPSLPKYDGAKTSGVHRFGESDISLLSGCKGPSASMPKGTPGMNGNIKSHVETHASAIMREQGVSESTLYIIRIPCPGKTGCDAMLPKMLPEGARLRVIGPNGFERIYIGLPD